MKFDRFPFPPDDEGESWGVFLWFCAALLVAGAILYVFWPL